MTLHNDGIHDTSIDGAIQLFKDVYEWRADVAFALAPSNSSYRSTKEYFRTSLNVSKIIQGFRGNFIIAPIIDSLIKSINMDFELKFPFKARNYSYNNFTIPGHLFPSAMSVMFIGEFKHWVRVSRKRSVKMDHSSTFKAYGRLNC